MRVDHGLNASQTITPFYDPMLAKIIASGATREEAQAELTTAMAQFARDYPEASAGTSGKILSFWEAPRGPQRLLIGGLTILQSVMLLLLLAVCGNTANLMLARGSARQREMAVRLAPNSSSKIRS